MINVEQNPVGPQRQFRRSGKKTVCNSRGSAHFIRRVIHRLVESCFLRAASMRFVYRKCRCQPAAMTCEPHENAAMLRRGMRVDLNVAGV
jgi:hypothetical protein